MDRRGNFEITQLVKTILVTNKGVCFGNKIKIFEGDIFIINENDDEWYDYVEYRLPKMKFELHNFHKDVTDISLRFAIEDPNCRIIGNKFQNPELLNIYNTKYNEIRN